MQSFDIKPTDNNELEENLTHSATIKPTFLKKKKEEEVVLITDYNPNTGIAIKYKGGTGAQSRE